MRHSKLTLDLIRPELQTELELPYSEDGVKAGFPSPAQDFMEMGLDLNKALIRNPSATFYARVCGVSMIDDGIDDDDLLIIDRSIEPFNNCLAVCFIDGEFTLKRFKKEADFGWLIPANSDYQPIKVTADNDFRIWGVVSYIIKKMS